MKRRSHLATAVSVLLLAAAGSSNADSREKFATEEDVIGFWEMLPLTKPEKVNKVNP